MNRDYALSAIRYCDQRLYVIEQMIEDYSDILDKEYKKWQDADEQNKAKIDAYINEVDQCRWLQQHKFNFYWETKNLYIKQTEKIKSTNGGNDEPASD